MVFAADVLLIQACCSLVSLATDELPLRTCCLALYTSHSRCRLSQPDASPVLWTRFDCHHNVIAAECSTRHWPEAAGTRENATVRGIFVGRR